MQLGQRIMIIGSGGAGKSTLARRLGEALGLPVIHLDAEYWRPGWVETPRDEWRRRVEALAQGERWIIDGNYGGTLPIRLARAETVIFLDYPWWLCLWRVLKRQRQYRGRTRPDLTPGCIERLQWDFLKWICLDFPRRSRGRILQLLAEHGAHARIIMPRSPGETRRLVAALAKEKDGIMAPLRLGIIASHGGSNLQAIIDASRTGQLNAIPCVVISNNGDSLALTRARSEGIPAYHLSRRTHPDPEMLDEALWQALVTHGVEVLVLAGYMKKLGAKTLRHFSGRILNIHPALLPNYGGQGICLGQCRRVEPVPAG